MSTFKSSIAILPHPQDEPASRRSSKTHASAPPRNSRTSKVMLWRTHSSRYCPFWTALTGRCRLPPGARKNSAQEST